VVIGFGFRFVGGKETEDMNFSKTKTVALAALALSGASAFLNLVGTKTTPSRAAIARVNPGSPGAPDSAARVRDAYGKLPLAFEQNQRQANEATNFEARGAGYTLSLSATEATFLLARGSDESATVLRMNLVGANPAAAVEGLNALEGKVNYLIGNDPAQWRTNIPTFGRVHYREVYPGIDVVYYGNQRRLEYDFVVSPGTSGGNCPRVWGRAQSRGGRRDRRFAAGDWREKHPAAQTDCVSGHQRREARSRGPLRSSERRARGL
jgi:hypothetical protein